MIRERERERKKAGMQLEWRPLLDVKQRPSLPRTVPRVM